MFAEEQVTQIAATPLLRAQETAQPLVAQTGLRLCSVDGWAEADRHLARYLSTETLRAQGVAEWQRFLEDSVRYLSGDPVAFRAAVMGALRATLDAPHDAHVAVFTHGLPIDLVLAQVLGLDRTVHFRPGYGSITWLLASGERLRIVSVNENAHHRLISV